MTREPIDYKKYAQFMRGALSGPEICNKDLSLNHAYFNAKKGFYWSEDNQEQLVQAILAHDLNFELINAKFAKQGKTAIEIELRTCLIFNVKDVKAITEKDLKEFKKERQTKRNGKKE